MTMAEEPDGLVHSCAHSFLGIGGPVFAVEANEDGRVRNGHGRLEDEDVEFLACRVDLGDDALVQHGFDGVVAENLCDLGSVSRCAGSVVVRDEGEFLIHVDERANMDGIVDGAKYVAKYVEVRGVGLDRLNAGGGLERVSGIDNENPVAMAEEGHGFADFGLPVGRGGRGRRPAGRWRVQQWCEDNCGEDKMEVAHRNLDPPAK